MKLNITLGHDCPEFLSSLVFLILKMAKGHGVVLRVKENGIKLLHLELHEPICCEKWIEARTRPVHFILSTPFREGADGNNPDELMTI